MIKKCLGNSVRNGKNCRWRIAVFGENGGSAAISSVIRVGTYNSQNLQQQKKSRSLSSKLRLIRRVQIFYTKSSISPPLLIFSFSPLHDNYNVEWIIRCKVSVLVGRRQYHTYKQKGRYLKKNRQSFLKGWMIIIQLL